jgi:hypothetical protein
VHPKNNGQISCAIYARQNLFYYCYVVGIKWGSRSTTAAVLLLHENESIPLADIDSTWVHATGQKNFLVGASKEYKFWGLDCGSY